jgi:DNA topoisomerase-1
MPTSRRLYELIWKRAVASQMESASIERTTVDVNAPTAAPACAPPAGHLFDGF